MKDKILKITFTGISLLIVMLLFTVVDYSLHELKGDWAVPPHYFVNKIPFGFLWSILGIFFAKKFQNIWLKSLVFSLVISITLQFRYFIEGYPLDFVVIFLLLHFLILYVLSLGMFQIFKKIN
jgi:hypothetical protein